MKKELSKACSNTLTLTSFILLTLFCSLLPIIAYGHGEAGMTIVGSVDGYTGDTDYDATFVQAGVPGRFVFNLFRGDQIDVAGTGVEFDDLWVHISRKTDNKFGQIIFAGPISKPLFGGAGMTMVIPEPGDYTITVRYNKDDSKIVEIAYDFTAYPPEEEEQSPFTFDFFVGLGAGFGGAVVLAAPLVFLLTRRKGDPKKHVTEKSAK